MELVVFEATQKMVEEKMKMAVAYEESLARDTPVTAAIHTVELPPDDAKSLEAVARDVYGEYRHIFKNFEEAEYFSMLPLSVKQRDHVLSRAVALHDRKQEEKKMLEDKCVSGR